MRLKILAFLLITFFSFTITPTLTLAANNYATSSANLVVEANPSQFNVQSPQYANLVLLNIFHAIGCVGAGVSPIFQPCVDYLLKTDPQGMIKSTPVLSSINLSGGALGSINSVIGGMYAHKPLSTTEYLTDVSKGFGLVLEAHAQITGNGNALLSPVLALWQVSRNLAYLALIIIFIVVGIMIMFRNKVNPQTIISIQAALPGLIVGLLLITFSYFIAAFITDFAFVGTNLVGYYFNFAGATKSTNLVADTANQNVMTLIGQLMNGINRDEITYGAAAFFDNLHGLSQDMVRLALAVLAFQTAAPIGNAVGSIGGTAACGALTGLTAGALAATIPICAALGGVAGSSLAGGVTALFATSNPPAFIGTVVWVIALAILIYTMFRLLLRLINNYLTIIFLTITAPFTFLAASLPGRQGLATDWIRNMLCNVLAFPSVMAVLFFAAYLLGPNPVAAFAISHRANLAGTTTFPLFGNLDLTFINLLLAYGAMLATPAIPDIVCRAIGKVGPAGQLIGQELSTAQRGGRGYFDQTRGGAGRIGSNVQSGFTNAANTARENYARGLVTPGMVAGTGNRRFARWIYKF